MVNIVKYIPLVLMSYSFIFAESYIDYKVKKGDTLYGIAFQNNMNVSDFLKINNIESPDKYNLKVGDILKVKAADEDTGDYTLVYDTESKTYALKKMSGEDKNSIEKALVTYTVKEGDTLYGIAFQNNMNVTEFLTINNIKNPDLYKLTVGEKFKVYEKDVPKKQEVKPVVNTSQNSDKSLKTYTVKNGDTLYGIAFENNMKVNEFLNLNNIKNPASYKLLVGEKLKIYESSDTKKEETKGVQVYTVKKGDTLSAIAKNNSMNLSDIYSLNNINSKYVLKVGDKIKVYSSSSQSSSKPVTPSYRSIETYKVKRGDTLSELAVSYNMDLIDLYSLNNIDSKYLLKEGDNLKVYALEKALVTYIVKQGDTLYSIARNYKMDLKDLLKLNNIDNLNTYVLKVGDKIKVVSQISSAKTENNPLPPSSFIWPYKGSVVLRYGVGDDKLANRGINISGNIGDNVIASDTGIVEYVGNIRGFGFAVIIKHKNGYNTAYAHLSDITVKLGDIVNKGDIIGHIGNTGFTDKNELYFKISYQGIPIDPLKLLPKG